MSVHHSFGRSSHVYCPKHTRHPRPPSCPLPPAAMHVSPCTNCPCPRSLMVLEHCSRHHKYRFLEEGSACTLTKGSRCNVASLKRKLNCPTILPSSESLHTHLNPVPPLLGIFYNVVGLLQLSLDKWLASKDRVPRTSLKRLIFSLISLIIILELSAEMYKSGIPYNIESYALFALAELNWVLFDGTWWGFALAAIVGVGCPLSEVPLMKFFNVWYYPKANVEVFGEGLITWVLACYFSYTLHSECSHRTLILFDKALRNFTGFDYLGSGMLFFIYTLYNSIHGLQRSRVIRLFHGEVVSSRILIMLLHRKKPWQVSIL